MAYDPQRSLELLRLGTGRLDAVYRVAFVEEVLEREIDGPVTDVQVAAMLHVSESQAKMWLERLVDEGTFEKLSGPIRYRSTKRADGSP